jgi:hypothetical protein
MKKTKEEYITQFKNAIIKHDKRLINDVTLEEWYHENDDIEATFSYQVDNDNDICPPHLITRNIKSELDRKFEIYMEHTTYDASGNGTIDLGGSPESSFHIKNNTFNIFTSIKWNNI